MPATVPADPTPRTPPPALAAAVPMPKRSRQVGAQDGGRAPLSSRPSVGGRGRSRRDTWRRQQTPSVFQRSHRVVSLAVTFAGVYCEINFDDCASNPCVHGACLDGVNRYSCVCSPGFTGKERPSSRGGPAAGPGTLGEGHPKENHFSGVSCSFCLLEG